MGRFWILEQLRAHRNAISYADGFRYLPGGFLRWVRLWRLPPRMFQRYRVVNFGMSCDSFMDTLV